MPLTFSDSFWISCANGISFARILVAPLILWLLLEQDYMSALILFTTSALSDAIDGFLARRAKTKNILGVYLDPLADKILLVSIYIFCGIMEWLHLGLVILVVFRDTLIVLSLALAQLLDVRHGVISPTLSSKINTTAQMLLVLIVLIGQAAPFMKVSPLYGFPFIFLPWIVAATTLISGIQYLWLWWIKN
ncbi:MAG: CDP-alcohol phosphatidyltransferase family protein [Alphaproteobacteria bacterium GM202ARS2]|nr:CDP-alcohol phosphatidyltransferase family protein [Alphaproteobacteria bacterium GM202ARS2]